MREHNEKRRFLHAFESKAKGLPKDFQWISKGFGKAWARTLLRSAALCWQQLPAERSVTRRDLAQTSQHDKRSRIKVNDMRQISSKSL